MAEMVVAGIVEEAAVFGLKKSLYWIRSKIESSKQLEYRYRTLDHALKKLLAMKEDNEKEVQRHKHKDTTTTYESWTNRVSMIAAEADTLINKYEGRRIQRRRIWKRSSLSEKMERMLKEIDQLERGCPKDFLVDKTEPVLKEFGVPQITEYPTLQGCLESIVGLLKNGNIKAVGVCGSKGLGKTTIMRNLNNNEEVAELFEMVIFTRVGSAKTIHELQRAIAKRWMVDKEAMEDPGEVARRIHIELENKKYLLILDDIVDHINLEELGIPDNNNGSKVVMATEFRHVFKSNNVQRLIRVEKLLPDEAWKMFQNITGSVIDYPGVKGIAWNVCQKCSCIPLLIDKIASTFQLNDSVRSWRAGWDDLNLWPDRRYQGLEELYSFLKSCYDKLDDENEQKCFLYTSLYPSDSKVYSDYLVECWAALDFLGPVNNKRRYQKARDRGYGILEHLIRVSFLDEGEGLNYVRMNDCIKQLALHISLRLETWQPARWVSKIGQTQCDLPTNQDCNKVLALLLQKNPKVEISSELLRNMSNLVLLDLYGTSIGSLPSSITQLTNLKGLYLNDCMLLMVLPCEISSLRHLQVLDVRGSGVTFIPSHLKDLTNLRCLRISYGTGANQRTDENVEADHNVISALLSLEELVIDVISYAKWCNDAEHVIRQVASLTNLSVFICCFPSPNILQEFLKTSESWPNEQQFNSFQFFVGCESSKCHQIIDSFEYRINNYLKYCNGEKNDDLAIAQILPRTDAFELVSHKDIRSVSSWVKATSMDQIRGFLIERCNKMQTIIEGDMDDNVEENGTILPNFEHLCSDNAMNQIEEDRSILPTLEHLYLDNLLRLKWAFRGRLHPKALSKLKTLTLRNCPMLKTVFFKVASADFSQLQKLTIQDCQKIVEIINVSEKVKKSHMLPKLEMLVLDGLPNLSIVCKDEILAWPSLESLHIHRCPRLKTLPFGPDDAANLRSIKSEQQCWNSLDWTNKDKERFQSIFATSNN